ncbi:MFS transporter [Streptomyces sp. NPDC060048]|uniref:MFS transporter n=1 Tax=unclassified Streptomyces TaxID=2593676 RepID=UPI0036C26459
MTSLPGPRKREGAGRGNASKALRHRNYRLFLAGEVVSDTGTWMQRVAEDWIVLELTGSTFAVGITMALQSVPLLLFGLWGGLIADRLPKRGVLLATQSLMGALSGVLALLAFTGDIRVWHVYLIAALLGVLIAVDIPTRQAFVTELVGREGVSAALGLNSAAGQLAKVTGPAVAGVLIAGVGGSWAMAFNAGTYLCVVLALLLMRKRDLRAGPRAARARKQVRAGLRYVSGQPGLVIPISMAAAVGTFGYNFPVFLSSFTKTVFGRGPEAYGLLTTLLALGSLCGALAAARRTEVRPAMLTGAALCFGILEVAASLSPSFVLFCALLTCTGLCGMLFTSGVSATLQLASDMQMRGRVVSLYVLVLNGSTAIGGPLIGWLAAASDPRVALAAGGTTSILAAVGASAWHRRIAARPTPGPTGGGTVESRLDDQSR